MRALETARLACEQLGVEVTEDERLAGGPFDPRAVAAGLGEEVMLVGHEPDFSMALHRMTGAQVRMKKGGLAGVDRGELKVLLRPVELQALAGRLSSTARLEPPPGAPELARAAVSRRAARCAAAATASCSRTRGSITSQSWISPSRSWSFFAVRAPLAARSARARAWSSSST